MIDYQLVDSVIDSLDTPLVDESMIRLEYRRPRNGMAPKLYGVWNGYRVMVKGPTYLGSDEYDSDAFFDGAAEVICSRIARVLGIPAQRVLLTYHRWLSWCNDLRSTIHIWDDGIMMHWDYCDLDPNLVETSSLVSQTMRDWMFAVRLFDTLVYNCDRHGGNIGWYSNDQRVFILDHGLARPWEHQYVDLGMIDECVFEDMMTYHGRYPHSTSVLYKIIQSDPVELVRYATNGIPNDFLPHKLKFDMTVRFMRVQKKLLDMMRT